MKESHRFLMLGKYHNDGLARVNANRTKRVASLIDQMGGRLCDAYALLGEYDVALIVELPGNDDALKLAATLATSLGLTLATFPAIPIDEFDRMAEALETEIESARMEAGE